MRIIHSSDWHLGHELYGFDRAYEHDRFLAWLGRTLIEQQADVLIVSGDIYDTANPSIVAQERLYNFIKKLLTNSEQLQIILLGGNHDSASRLELPRPLLDPQRVHLIGAMPRHEGQLAPERALITLFDKNQQARAVCAAVPYLRPGDLLNYSVQSLYQTMVTAAQANHPGLPIIATGHLHISGSAVSELSERRIIVGGEEALSATIFPADISYVALGHLHKPQAITGNGLIRYAGSPFPMSVTEKDYQHSIVMIDLKKDCDAALTLLPIPRPVEFIRIPERGAAELTAVEADLLAIDIPDPGRRQRPFLEIAVQLQNAEPDLRRRIDQAIKDKPLRLTRIVRQTAGQGGVLADNTTISTLAELDPREVFTRCHIAQYDRAPDDELSQAFNELLADVLAPPDTTAT